MENLALKKKTSVYIETYGCQMNKYDSELVSGLLIRHGYHLTDSFDKADIVMINTCSVRDHAEKRVLGRIGAMAAWKRRVPDRKLGIIGCMGQRLGSDLLKKKPYLDFIVGPDSYSDLPEILNNGFSGPCIRTRLDEKEVYDGIRPEREPGVSGWIAISRGCDNFCSYCIVPYTRGRERSRSAMDILAELKTMAEQGYREVTFLGQNVNSYHDGDADFPDLLRSAAREKGILRIRFMTSHPKDVSDRLLDAMADEAKLCPHLHLPVQSGANRILDRMHRGYTRKHVLQWIEKARKKIPHLAVTSDIMVGFPGETEAEFRQTCTLVEEVRFDEAYTYAYSPRPGTQAARWEETLSPREKSDRLAELIRIQRGITVEIKRGMVGSRFEVFVEGTSRRSDREWMGKTPANHVVVFPGESSLRGDLVRVRIEQCRGATLRGKVVEPYPVRHSTVTPGNQKRAFLTEPFSIPLTEDNHVGD
jgi:tRNA-2-methylthio-N6-dimethylallyladenosine synthase